ncbi:MAG: hypothetical protein R6V46_11045 [Desulfatiglandaceae bacterium]|jgi:hypothetical protein
MPMIDLKDTHGNSKWIHVFPFHSIELARSYVNHSSVSLRIVKADANLYWVCTPDDAAWAISCGYQEVK